MENCKKCKFCRLDTLGTSYTDKYKCKRHAPRPGSKGKWPTVSTTDWYGEFKPAYKDQRR